MIRKLREGERLQGEGKVLAEVLRQLDISEVTWNRWRNQYGGMKANGTKRLRELQVENGAAPVKRNAVTCRAGDR